ncbi:MAG: Hpt domain-containing protein [Spirochaetaceae bacterium]|nr:Hpt domain-containing protein [Spirochaetaceae bacterium]
MEDSSREVNEPGMVYIDVEEGLKRVMQNKALYGKLLHKLKTDTHFEELIAALKTQDYDRAQTAVHAIKGMAANLSLRALFTEAQALEERLKNGVLDAGGLEGITRCYEQTLVTIDTVLERYP